jgi:transposase
MEADHYTSQDLGHLGIVAGVCNEIGLIERVDQIVGPTERKVSVGQAVQAMVINGLGFVGRALYLTPEFFRNKPVDILVGEGLTADDLDANSLGRALDRVFETGVTEVFAYVAAAAVKQAGVSTRHVHLDSTSFALQGEYEIASDEDTRAIQITHGYSRDHRPDLKQAMLSLICTHQGALPTWLEPLDGNQADSGSFPRIVSDYIDQLQEGEERTYLVADTALYSAGTLQELGDQVYWVTRVPASIGAVKALYQTVEVEDMFPIQDGSYRLLELCTTYGGVRQRWLLVFSEGLYQRESQQLCRVIDKECQEAQKQLRKLGRRRYPSPEAAQAAVETLADRWKYHTVQLELSSHPKYHHKGRPAKGQLPDYVVWQPLGTACENETRVNFALRSKGKFALATNDLDSDQLPLDEWLALYKGQNLTVERGFRFLKDPLFFAHSLFLKKPARIMALLMIMGLCLLIYALAEHHLRSELLRRDETLPDQKGKPTQRITMRRVFQIFEGIHILLIPSTAGSPQRFILNLNDLHRRILDFLGPGPKKCYFLLE